MPNENKLDVKFLFLYFDIGFELSKEKKVEKMDTLTCQANKSFFEKKNFKRK